MNTSNNKQCSDEKQVRAVIESYVSAIFEADVERLRSIFSEGAIMNGYLDGNLLEGNPEPFFVDIGSKPSLKELGANFTSQIDSISITGNVASVSLTEHGFGPFSFTDYFHLLKKNNDWKIVSKIFTSY